MRWLRWLLRVAWAQLTVEGLEDAEDPGLDPNSWEARAALEDPRAGYEEELAQERLAAAAATREERRHRRMAVVAEIDARDHAPSPTRSEPGALSDILRAPPPPPPPPDSLAEQQVNVTAAAGAAAGMKRPKVGNIYFFPKQRNVQVRSLCFKCYFWNTCPCDPSVLAPSWTLRAAAVTAALEQQLGRIEQRDLDHMREQFKTPDGQCDPHEMARQNVTDTVRHPSCSFELAPRRDDWHPQADVVDLSQTQKAWLAYGWILMVFILLGSGTFSVYWFSRESHVDESDLFEALGEGLNFLSEAAGDAADAIEDAAEDAASAIEDAAEDAGVIEEEKEPKKPEPPEDPNALNCFEKLIGCSPGDTWRFTLYRLLDGTNEMKYSRAIEVFMGVVIAVNFADFVWTTHLKSSASSFVKGDSLTTRILEYSACCSIIVVWLLRFFSTPANPKWNKYKYASVAYLLLDANSWFDLAAVIPWLCDEIMGTNRFPNLTWLRFPRLLEMLLSSSAEGFAEFRTILNRNAEIFELASMIGLGMLLISSGLFYVTEQGNEQNMRWGTQPGYDRYSSIPQSMYVSLLTLQGEFPLASKYSPGGRFSALCSAIIGYHIMAIPCGLFGSSFAGFVKMQRRKMDMKREEKRQTIMARRKTAVDSAPLALQIEAWVEHRAFTTVLGLLLSFSLASFVSAQHALPHATAREMVGKTWLLPWCRGADFVLGIIFCVEYVARVYAARATHVSRREYLLSFLGLVDFWSWAPAIAGGVLYFIDMPYASPKQSMPGIHVSWPQACHACAVIRLGKCDRWFEIIRVLIEIFQENWPVFKATGIFAIMAWLFASTCLYYTERLNVDIEMIIQYKSVLASMWITLLSFFGEAPLVDHTAQGRAINALVMLVGVGIFAVPMSVIGVAFRNRLEEKKQTEERLEFQAKLDEEDRIKAERERIQALNEQNAGGIQLELPELPDDDDETFGKYRSNHWFCPKFRAQLNEFSHQGSMRDRVFVFMMGTKAQRPGIAAVCYEFFAIFLLATSVFVAGAQTLEYFHGNEHQASCAHNRALNFGSRIGTIGAEWCEPIHDGMEMFQIFTTAVFAIEYLVRLAVHPTRLPFFCSFVTMVNLFSWLPMLVVKILASCDVIHPQDRVLDTDSAVTWQALLTMFRVLRVLVLESYFPSISLVVQVIYDRGELLFESVYVVFILSCWAGTMTMLLERGDDTIEDGLQLGIRYADFWVALQYSMIHLTGDFPIFHYRPAVKVVQGVFLMIGWAAIAVPCGILCTGFREAFEELHDRRMQQRPSLARKTRILEARKTGVFENSPAWHQNLYLVASSKKFDEWCDMLVLVNVFLVLADTVPELHELKYAPSIIDWCEFVCVVPMTIQFLCRLCTPKFEGQTFLNFLFSFTSLLHFICLIPFWYNFIMGRLGQEADTRLYALSQCFWIFLYERNSQFFADVWNDCKNSFFAVGCLSFSFWAISSAIWYTFEQEDTPWMTSLPSTMYFTALFLTGEWHFADFSSGLGIFFCLLYCVFGVGIFALPVGMLTDSLSFLLEDFARDPLTETESSEESDEEELEGGAGEGAGAGELSGPPAAAPKASLAPASEIDAEDQDARIAALLASLDEDEEEEEDSIVGGRLGAGRFSTKPRRTTVTFAERRSVARASVAQARARESVAKAPPPPITVTAPPPLPPPAEEESSSSEDDPAELQQILAKQAAPPAAPPAAAPAEEESSSSEDDPAELQRILAKQAAPPAAAPADDESSSSEDLGALAAPPAAPVPAGAEESSSSDDGVLPAPTKPLPDESSSESA